MSNTKTLIVGSSRGPAEVNWTEPDALDLLSVIAALLESKPNRFGKLEFYSDEARAARQQIQEMAVALQVGPSETVLQQAAKVAREFITRAKARGPSALLFD
jgi:hypothetical protein